MKDAEERDLEGKVLPGVRKAEKSPKITRGSTILFLLGVLLVVGVMILLLQVSLNWIFSTEQFTFLKTTLLYTWLLIFTDRR